MREETERRESERDRERERGVVGERYRKFNSRLRSRVDISF